MEQRSDYPYHAFYCEENIWQLAKQRKEDNAQVWFIINPNKSVATALQKVAADQPFVIWDYHVIYYSPSQGIYDFDTLCDFPCATEKYLQHSFLDFKPYLDANYHSYFRVIPAEEYLQRFASDRRHMKDKQGNYLEAPPKWPPIGEGHNLAEFIEFDKKGIGEIFDIESLPYC